MMEPECLHLTHQKAVTEHEDSKRRPLASEVDTTYTHPCSGGLGELVWAARMCQERSEQEVVFPKGQEGAHWGRRALERGFSRNSIGSVSSPILASPWAHSEPRPRARRWADETLWRQGTALQTEREKGDTEENAQQKKPRAGLRSRVCQGGLDRPGHSPRTHCCGQCWAWSPCRARLRSEPPAETPTLGR